MWLSALISCDDGPVMAGPNAHWHHVDGPQDSEFRCAHTTLVEGALWGTEIW